MRADRLLAIMMLLQNRGRLSAAALAGELEVSQRTIYRDIDALCTAGVPVYSQHGPNGGFALLDSFRTNLTGLTEGEVRALLMLSIPGPLVELGLSDALRTALLKLSAALPAERRPDEERVRQRFLLDWEPATRPQPGGQTPDRPARPDSVSLLQTLHQAIWQDRQIRLVYRPMFAATIQRQDSPYGLVAQSGRWYLVVALPGGRLQVQPLSEIFTAQITDEPFARPADFDLTAFWHSWRRAAEAALVPYLVTVRVSPPVAGALAHYFGSQLQSSAPGPPDVRGRLTVQLSFESLEAARERLLGLGQAVEVLAPQALRLSIADYAKQIAAVYRECE